MKAKTRLASKAKPAAQKMAAECEKLACEAGEKYRLASSLEDRLAALEAQSAYNQMAANWSATALRAEEISPQKFTGRNKGPSSLSLKRIQFINEISSTIGPASRDAIAAEAVGKNYAKRAKALWPGKPIERESKILTFMRNNAKNLGLSFED